MLKNNPRKKKKKKEINDGCSIFGFNFITTMISQAYYITFNIFSLFETNL